MDLSEKDKLEFENRIGDHLGYQSSDLSAPEWRFGNQLAVPQGTHMCSSPNPSADSFWSQPTNSQALGFCHNTSNGAVKSLLIPPRLDMGGGVFLHNGNSNSAGIGILPPSLSHFPTDSAFIERAARFSCFGNGGFSAIMNPFNGSDSLSPYADSSSRNAHEAQVQESINHGSNSGSPIKGRSSEPEISEEATNLGDSCSKDHDAVKKRKRTDEDMELDQVEGARQLDETTMTPAKASGKQVKDSKDEGKEDYIHVRARRGQATNSHSLAERVRREKISERMKFLQDLVPGCSKVTGKAVMLDEIINYVQSLQRQVEFLSMKLAAVNQRLDFNVEGLLSKDFLQSRVGSSSAMGFSHDIIHRQLLPPQSGLIPAGMSSMTHLTDTLRRGINTPHTMTNGYKGPTSQLPNVWEEELQNVFQMNFGATTPLLNSQEPSGKPRDGFPILTHHQDPAS